MNTDNTLPSGIDDLKKLGGDIAEGLKLHGPWLKMTQTPEAAFRAVLGRLDQAETLYGEARASKGEIGKQSVAADKVLTDWLVRTRALLTSVLGQRWSERWLEVGVVSRRTAVPKRMAPRVALAAGMIHWMEKNPDYEMPVAGITAENGKAIRERMVQAQRELRAAKAACLVKKRARDAAERTLRRKMRQVVVILGVSIRPEDRRWLDFGLNRPLRSLGNRPAAAGIGATESESVLPVTFQTDSPDSADAAVAA